MSNRFFLSCLICCFLCACDDKSKNVPSTDNRYRQTYSRDCDTSNEQAAYALLEAMSRAQAERNRRENSSMFENAMRSDWHRVDDEARRQLDRYNTQDTLRSIDAGIRDLNRNLGY